MASITDRIDNVTRIPPAYQHARLPAPKSVKIEISPRCNYRCGFCALRTREVQPKWDMDFGLFKRVTREMHEAGVEDVGVFYLGESFIIHSGDRQTTIRLPESREHPCLVLHGYSLHC